MLVYPRPRLDMVKAEIGQRYQILKGSAAYDTNHLARTAALTFGVPIVHVALVERYRRWFSAAHGVNTADAEAIETLGALSILSDTGFCIEDARTEPYFAQEAAVKGSPHIAFFAGTPLRDPGGKRFGTLCLFAPEPRRLTPREERTLQSFGDVISSDLCLRSAARYCVNDLIDAESDKIQLYDLAMTDPLSGALNRRAFTILAQREVRRSLRHHNALSAVMVDIDHFKRVNDTYGHAVGDEVIASVAALINRIKRQEDLLGRLGGEEFGLILPDTDIEQALRMTDRLIEAIRGLSFTGGSGTFRITASLGVASLRGHDDPLSEFLRRADEALYKAKENGRNRVEVHGEDALGLPSPSPRDLLSLVSQASSPCETSRA